jgi:Holliday junction resolvase RusA-like endonuclease
MVYTLHCPIKIKVSSKKYFIINLNNYRNAHYFTLNKAKQEFSSLMGDQIILIPPLNKIKIEYIVYPQSARKLDINNIVSIVDKFLCDALVNFNVIKDDNYNVVVGISAKFGNIDKKYPRVEAKIHEIV